MPFEIPNSWCWVRLNDLGIFKKGPFGSSLTKSMFVPESTKSKVKVYEQKNAIQKNANIGHYFISYEKFESMKGFIVGPGELIVSCAGTIGEIFQLPENAEVGIINQALMKIHLYYQSLCAYFILYFDFALKSQTAEEGKGTCMKNIPPFSILKEKLFPLPPENEIRKILESIKKIFIQIDAIIKNDCSIRTISNALRNKILNQFFGENSSYKSYYPNYYIKDLCQLDKGKSEQKGVYPYLEAKVIRGIKKPKYIKSGCFIEKGTKVILVDGENSGEVMIVPFDGYLGSTFRILATRDSISSEYLMWFIEYYKKTLKSNKTGSAVPHLNKNIFYNLTIALPPLKVQEKYSREITKSFNLLKAILS